MGKYSLCIIDDKIPVEQFQENIVVDNTGIIDQNVLFHYLSNETKWGDSNLLALIKSIKVQAESPFFLSGFKTHSFYLNYIDATLFSPDVIVFDWDVGVGNSEESLKSILEKTYCLIAVYTGADKTHEVSEILAKDEFKKNEHRLFLLNKDTDGSSATLITKITDSLKNFSLNNNNKLKKLYCAALNTVLSSIGRLSIDQFICLFGEKIEDGYKLATVDFIEIINEKMKSRIIAPDKILDISPLTTTSIESVDDVEAIKRMWNFRMYHTPNDDIVRRGDIVWHKDDKRYYLIISSDCHLADFWRKSLGFLATIPLYKVNDENLLSKITSFMKEGTRKNFKVSSLVNPHGINGITILPAVNGVDDYLLSPKILKTIDIIPNKTSPSKHLVYADISIFDSTKRYRLNEPFLSALIEFALRGFADVGVPDYSDKLQEELAKHITEIKAKKEETADVAK